MKIKFVLLILSLVLGLSACASVENTPVSSNESVASVLEKDAIHSQGVSADTIGGTASVTVSVVIGDPDASNSFDEENTFSMPETVVSVQPASPPLDSPAHQTWKQAVWDAWHLPENEKPAAYVDGEAIPKRLPLLLNASNWLVIHLNIEQGMFANQEEQTAFIEQYGKTYEESLHEWVLIEIAYREGLKQGFRCSEETAREAVTERLDSHRLVEGDYEFVLEANGFNRQEYIERYTLQEQKNSVGAQFRHWLKQNLPNDWPTEDAGGYVTHYLESKMEEYGVKIVD